MRVVVVVADLRSTVRFDVAPIIIDKQQPLGGVIQRPDHVGKVNTLIRLVVDHACPCKGQRDRGDGVVVG